MIRAVLFDLDGTLLDIQLDLFLREYFAALGPVVAEVVPGITAEEGLPAVMAGTEAMSRPHPGMTNREAFNARFHAMTGANLDLEEFALPFERFYREVFPSLRRDFGPFTGARSAVKLCLELGLKVAIATNPIFPRDAIIERMRWAGIDDLKVHAITTYENMHATKPHAAYFAETAADARHSSGVVRHGGRRPRAGHACRGSGDADLLRWAKPRRAVRLERDAGGVRGTAASPARVG